MANWNYLNTYVAALPSAQRQRLLNLLYADVQSGKTSSLASYEAKLAIALNRLSTSIPKSTFVMRPASYQGMTSSANFNDMESTGIASMQNLYQEAVSLAAGVNSHVRITDSKLDTIEAAISRAEKQVASLEILAANTDGYVQSTFDSFAEGSSNRLNRGDTEAKGLAPFTLPDLGTISADYDAKIDNGRLRLPLLNETTYGLIDAWLANQTPVGSSISSSSDIPDTESQYDTRKLIDDISQHPDTYWAETIQTKSLSGISCAECDLVVMLEGIQQINRVLIDPFTRFPYQITSIKYKKDKNATDSFDLDPNFETLTLTQPTILDFINDDEIEVLIFHIVQPSYSQLRYIANHTDETKNELFDIATGKQLDISNVTPDSVYYAMSNNMKTLLDIDTIQSTDTEIVDYYEFLYGIKNLQISALRYKKQGLYVSKPVSIPRAGAVGLETTEIHDSLTSPSTSVEYELLVSFSDNDITGPASYTYNILPTATSGTQMVTREILDFNAISKIAQTRFAVKDHASIYVYQNGNSEAMSAGSYTATPDPQGTGKYLITITGYSPTSRYMIKYEPTNDAYIVPLVKHDTASISLRILLRSHSSSDMVSPFVDSYSLKFKLYSGA